MGQKTGISLIPISPKRTGMPNTAVFTAAQSHPLPKDELEGEWDLQLPKSRRRGVGANSLGGWLSLGTPSRTGHPKIQPQPCLHLPARGTRVLRLPGNSEGPGEPVPVPKTTGRAQCAAGLLHLHPIVPGSNPAAPWAPGKREQFSGEGLGRFTPNCAEGCQQSVRHLQQRFLKSVGNF